MLGMVEDNRIDPKMVFSYVQGRSSNIIDYSTNKFSIQHS